MRAERLTIEAPASRTEDPWRLEGDAELATCPCDDPPVTWGIEGATVEPDGETTLDGPSLRAFGVPVFWLPALWIRAPDQVGLLPPFVAYRGDDGWLAGAGVFFPAPAIDDGALELRAGAYSEGGFQASGRLATVHSRSELTWDRTEGDRVGVASTGAVGPAAVDPPAAVAWDVDLLRGERASTGTPELDAAVRPFDRARGDVAVRPVDDLRLDAGFDAVGARGEGPLAIGPGIAGHYAGELSERARWEIGARTHQLARAIDPLSAAAVDFRFSQAPLVDPLQLDLEARGRLRTLDGAPDGAVRSDAAVQLGALGRLPFARRFGDGPDAWVHSVTPVLDVRAVIEGGEDRAAADPIGIGGAGVESWLTRWGASGFRVNARGGAISARGEPLVAAHTRWEIDAAVAAVWVEGAAIAPAEVETPRGGAVRGAVRIGPVAGPSASFDATARGGRSPGLARLLEDRERLPSDRLGYVDRRGVTGGAELRLPLSEAWLATSRVDADVVAPHVVAAGGALAYAHPCRCLDLRLFGGGRQGREGFDAGLELDLFPPVAALPP